MSDSFAIAILEVLNNVISTRFTVKSSDWKFLLVNARLGSIAGRLETQRSTRKAYVRPASTSFNAIRSVTYWYLVHQQTRCTCPQQWERPKVECSVAKRLLYESSAVAEMSALCCICHFLSTSSGEVQPIPHLFQVVAKFRSNYRCSNHADHSMVWRHGMSPTTSSASPIPIAAVSTLQSSSSSQLVNPTHTAVHCCWSCVSGGGKPPLEQSAAGRHLSSNADCLSEPPFSRSFPP